MSWIRWLVYNLSPSFNWAQHGFSGEHPLPCEKSTCSDCISRCRSQELYLGSRERGVCRTLSSLFHALTFFFSFVLQLISLAGLHSTAVTTGELILRSSLALTDDLFLTAELSSRFKEDGMLAYVELIQRKEKEIGCDVLTHQKW